MPAPQSFKSHTRFDPGFHYFLAPLLMINLVASIVATVRHWPAQKELYFWWIVMSLVLLIAIGKMRGYALKAQDRVIRLEERLRLAALLPPSEHARAYALTERQLIALRFASDAELPALVQRTLHESLTPKQIKESINSWRPDYFRI